MQTIEIIITKARVMEEVAASTAYAGAKTDTQDPESSYYRIAASSTDSAIFGRFWRECCSRIADELKNFVTDACFGDEVFSLSLLASGSFDAAFIPSVNADIHAAAVADLTASWFQYTVPARAQEWRTQCRQAIDNALSKLYHRKAPRRSKSK